MRTPEYSNSEVLELFANDMIRMMYEDQQWIKVYEQETGKSAFQEQEKEASL
ncbi:hypothetical protein [Eubacterium sp.]|uniref:hypothetical protein n=1 Tax=Eubacterium sp. TaxID=142586 RepID=UPI0026DF572C|nr:hypothetical protein [Eubacterium sp.]MDO5432992.1 hypothetical protein [Eubacterium sp.]